MSLITYFVLPEASSGGTSLSVKISSVLAGKAIIDNIADEMSGFKLIDWGTSFILYSESSVVFSFNLVLSESS